MLLRCQCWPSLCLRLSQRPETYHSFHCYLQIHLPYAWDSFNLLEFRNCYYSFKYNESLTWKTKRGHFSDLWKDLEEQLYTAVIERMFQSIGNHINDTRWTLWKWQRVTQSFTSKYIDFLLQGFLWSGC